MKNMKKLVFVLLFLLFLHFGCLSTGGTEQKNETKKTEMAYNITYCENRPTQTGWEVQKNENDITIIQTQSYVCCANISITMQKNDKTIRIYEENIGDYCRCICPFIAEIKIRNVEKDDSIEVYGIKYKDVYDYELIYRWPENEKK